jgi:hypothetical protein
MSHLAKQYPTEASFENHALFKYLHAIGHTKKRPGITPTFPSPVAQRWLAGGSG